MSHWEIAPPTTSADVVMKFKFDPSIAAPEMKWVGSASPFTVPASTSATASATASAGAWAADVEATWQVRPGLLTRSPGTSDDT